MSDTPRTDAHYKQILDDDLGLEYNETELRYWAEKLERELAEAKEQLRLCNVDQFTTAAELAEAIAKERERCAWVCERKIVAPAGTYQLLMAAADAIRKGE